MKRRGCGALVLAALIVGSTSGAAGQRLLDLDARAGAGPDVLARGPIAVFWNPAAVARGDTRYEVLAVDVRAPESTGLGGLALAGTARLDDLTTVGLGYQHAAVAGIRRTTTSPLSDEGEIDVSEDVFNLILARQLAESADVGVLIRYGHIAEIAGGQASVDVGAGVHVRPSQPWIAEAGAAIAVADDGANWLTGVALEPPLELPDWRLLARYGLEGSYRVHGLTHRIAASATWTERATVEVGWVAEPGAEGHTLTPVLGASFRLERYQVGVLRESLANGLGAIYSFRFAVQFGE